MKQSESMVARATDMSSSYVSEHTKQMQILQQVESSRIRADESLSSVSGSILTQKNHVNTTVSAMITHVDQAVAKACHSVDTTSQVANKTLQDVTSATVHMSGCAVQSMDAFTAFLDSTGNNLSTHVDTHFTDLSTYLLQQSKDIQQMKGVIHTYSDAVLASVVKPTGSTPVKSVFPELPSLVATREHDVIKNEVRSGVKINFADCVGIINICCRI